MEIWHIGLALLAVTFVGETYGQRRRQSLCEFGSCYPATGDLLIGRQNNLTANSTCGMDRPERYCIVSHLDDDKKCFLCDSRRQWSSEAPNSHRVENIVSSFRERKLRWWQAENGVQNVYIQLDLEAEFHFTHLIMTFKTFRPKAMYVERSYDFGNSWKIYRYFAYDCAKSFPGIPTGPVSDFTDVICESKYSDVVPSTNGEVIFRVLPPFIRVTDPYSQEVQDLLKLTNLRVVFTELHTLGDIVFDGRQDIKEKYYYAMYDMTVRGSCSCYGHASRCTPLQGYTNDPNMVNGQCECTHNTKGLNCEMCKDFYNDLPWRPARTDNPNACKECECYNHATTCHFDAGVYELTNKRSGGVCDDCQHNTMGRNCQECRPFFYQDPNKDLRDPFVCQSCDCDPAGSLYDGECENRDDSDLGLEAGRCLCKTYVTGRRCDSCVEGYFNLAESNPDGCDACNCNEMGTLENYSCDQYTGNCNCKRFVTGRTCDECYPGYWGMSNDPNGCRPCDCDVGGANGDVCDVITGQCDCKPNIMGRQCNQVEPGYFFTRMDWYMYEAEFATGYGNTRVYIREPDPRYVAWSGPGYMKVMEGDAIEFTGITVDFPMFYDIIIRYDPRMTDKWQDIRVSVIREGPTNPDGPCANAIPQDDDKTTSLQPGARVAGVYPPSCLESGLNYTVRIEFNKYRSDLDSPEATVLIDSIVLMPSTDSIPIFQGPGLPEYMKNEYIRYRCRELQLQVYRQELPEVCRKHVFSISSIIHRQALDCDCDLTGSTSFECDPVGGQCQCKENVVGRRCDQCAPGTYGFGPNGCIPCNCHNIGSRDNFCDIETGQCLCIPNVVNRVCDVCQPGYYGFPYCRECQCNDNAETCDNLTGECLDCQFNTTGVNCERCLDGFYGDPREEYRIPCEPCMCPKGPYHPAQHADSCYYDSRIETVVCQCDIGYEGPDCGTCSDNYFGNPMEINGTCEECVCNNNIDMDVTGNCDGETGECLKCLYNTEGFNCEKCSPGYYGDALTQSCRECVCNSIGTNMTAGPCDRITGQCPCLPNVVGLRCDQSAPGFWNMSENLGSVACDCDPLGSNSVDCNEFTGQCDCKEGRGGRTCSDCPELYYGDPLDQCIPCDCDTQGSSQSQCDRKTGQCVCLEGVTGYKCDRCARGTTGELPNCVPCGECFNNWDRIIRDLTSQTEVLLDQGRNIQIEGAAGAFDKEFRVMEDNLAEVRKIIEGAGVSSVDVTELENMIKEIRENLTANMEELDEVNGEIQTAMERTQEGNNQENLTANMEELDEVNGEIQTAMERTQEGNNQENLTANMEELDEVNGEIQTTMERTQEGNNRISALQIGVKDLNTKAQQLRRNASDIQAQDVEGAFNITKEAQIRSQRAQDIVDGTKQSITQSEGVRAQTEQLIMDNMADFNRSLVANQEALNSLDESIMELSGKVTDINMMVCDGAGDPCDDVCGGGGCGVCGGPSCDKGAVTRADNALDLAMKAEDILKMKEEDAQSLHTNVSEANELSQMARDEAQMAFEEASKARKISEDTRADLEKLLNDIRDFLSVRGARPSDIEQKAEEVLAMSISLEPQQITELARQINTTIQGLQDIDDILDATRDDLNTAQMLKERADNASKDADSILETAQGVLRALNGSSDAQQIANQAIEKADTDIGNAQTDLTQIESETAAAEAKSKDTLDKVDQLNTDLSGLQSKMNENEFRVQNAENVANEAADLATKASKFFKDTLDKVDQLNTDLFGLQSKMKENEFCVQNTENVANEAADFGTKASKDAEDLESQYPDVLNDLNNKYNSSAGAKARVEKLRMKADQLATETTAKLQKLRNMNTEYESYEKQLSNLQGRIDQLNEDMTTYLEAIQKKANDYRTCTT